MRVFVSAGEPSGDHHAALLVRAIRRRRPDAACVGLGGPHLEAEGCTLVADMTKLAVMWFLRVILNIHRFVDLARRAERSFLDDRPDVCVLVDFPGFHWWLAWRAKRHGIPVVFYCPPQIWAWASWRIGKMRRLVDHVLSALPFEHDWFTARGMTSTLVGHPFFDEIEAAETAATDVPPDAARPLVVLLPGSRGQEIEANLGTLLAAAGDVRRQVPEARFAIGAVHDRHARLIRERVAATTTARDLGIEVHVGRTRSLIHAARAAIACSGSVSLELLAARVPAVIVYRIGAFAYVVQSWCRHARFITLVNLLAAREPVGPVRGVWRAPAEVPAADPDAIYPEYLTVRDPAGPAAAHVVEWLVDATARARLVRRLDAVAAVAARPGSADRAAAAVISIAEGAPAARAPAADDRRAA